MNKSNVRKPIDALVYPKVARLEKSIRLLGNLSRKRLLNIGCKEGWLESYIVHNNIDVKAVHSIDVVDYGSPRGRSKIIFSLESVLKLQRVKKHWFDIAAFFEVMEHLPAGSELLALKNINRALRSGGRLCLSTPYSSFFGNLLDPAYWCIGHRHYTQRRVRHLLQQAGFMVVQMEVRGGFGESFGMLCYYFSRHVLRRRKMCANCFQKSRRKEYLSAHAGFFNLFVIAEKIRDV